MNSEEKAARWPGGVAILAWNLFRVFFRGGGAIPVPATSDSIAFLSVLSSRGVVVPTSPTLL